MKRSLYKGQLKMLFIFSVVFLFFVLLFYPKSDEREDIFAMVTLAIITIMELQALWGYFIFELFKIGFRLFYFTSYNFGVGVIILLYWIIMKRKKIQKFSLKLHTWIVVVLLLVLTMVIGIWRYGLKLNLFSYCSSDSAIHLGLIYKIFKFGDVADLKGRYFLHLNEALILKCMEPWIQPMSFYRIFLLMELVFYFFSGAIFYVLIEKYMTTKQNRVIGYIVLLLYVLGYPLNNLLYGYTYLGVSVTIAMHIEYLLERFIKKAKQNWEIIAALLLACFAMYHCYSLLFLGILVGMVVVYCIYTIQTPSFFKITLIGLGMAVVLYKTDFFVSYWNTMLNNLTTEAIMYRDLWQNILWFLPAMGVALRECLKKVHGTAIVGIFMGILGTMLLFSKYMLNGKISSYYYYKFYFLLWFGCLYLFYIGIITVMKENKKIIGIYFLVMLVFIISPFFLTENIKKEDNKLEKYLDIYNFNWDILVNKKTNMDMLRQELFYAAAEKVEETGGVVPYIGTWESYWMDYYYGLTNQVVIEVQNYQTWYAKNFYWDAGEDINTLLQQYIYDKYEDVPYIMVERNSDAYWYGIGYYSTLEVAYENEYGFIYKR